MLASRRLWWIVIVVDCLSNRPSTLFVEVGREGKNEECKYYYDTNNQDSNSTMSVSRLGNSLDFPKVVYLLNET